MHLWKEAPLTSEAAHEEPAPVQEKRARRKKLQEETMTPRATQETYGVILLKQRQTGTWERLMQKTGHMKQEEKMFVTHGAGDNSTSVTAETETPEKSASSYPSAFWLNEDDYIREIKANQRSFPVPASKAPRRADQQVICCAWKWNCETVHSKKMELCKGEKKRK
ncbi:hypothetical protein Anapl_09321 [Anas platyrhynchos]|uniref:Uncharacterized protein n=1 Tax=Anas platyrhynchos TaxID=8839 RepID=R0LXS3_ANAPL|nr:hypothetical protein Anapl_09321 [Anas platyrhynchos]